MSRWRYYTTCGFSRLEPPIFTETIVETVGDRQLEIMLTARRAASGSVVIEHGRQGNKTRLAARRLVERGLLAGPNFFGGGWGGRQGGVYIYTLTERGRECWLKVREQ